MARSFSLTHYVSIVFLRPTLPNVSTSRTHFLSLPLPNLKLLKTPISSISSLSFCTNTRYPLQYDMILHRPTQSSLDRRPARLARSTSPEPENPSSELGLEGWVDRKLGDSESPPEAAMDKAKRKYYNKRRRRMYGTDDSDEENRRNEDGFVELRPEVVDFPRLHKREEELYFYDTFAYPWEKEKHYKMVYQLEKKYFPDQCLDKAFLEPGQSGNVEEKNTKKKKKRSGDDGEEMGDDKRLVFFEEEKREREAVKDGGGGGGGVVTEKKVEEFFKCLKKVPNKDNAETGNEEPYLLTRTTELPPRWDSPNGTVVLVNKPKGWTSFTVCGKLRRLVKVKKVGHAGTLDPMATGLLIVCVGKATKSVDRYQGMIKGYSGVFRLGEATSTWDADSPVIQREPWEHIKDEDIRKAAASFCGEIWQVPPMFSAIKVGGEKMYEKARRGESIELSPRRISIFQFDIERSLDDRQNLIFRVICSKGTYIRSLCADLGKALGSCSHLTALRRDSIGEYSADDAWEFKELEEAISKAYF
ncbi:tRNA pseudouridine synthase B [Morus notabilis]|uniref:tRNA pseudouridine(55) synthase n=1 Tax=Morus notabilis TaxID=981085 RepID=W9S0S1_9ROSA|nr:uncharacterized protein LOC21403477 [Morus notabilis]EXC20363.1 tRNA pseudouridine synthase B [Morus notabilis]